MKLDDLLESIQIGSGTHVEWKISEPCIRLIHRWLAETGLREIGHEGYQHMHATVFYHPSLVNTKFRPKGMFETAIRSDSTACPVRLIGPNQDQRRRTLSLVFKSEIFTQRSAQLLRAFKVNQPLPVPHVTIRRNLLRYDAKSGTATSAMPEKWRDIQSFLNLPPFPHPLEFYGEFSTQSDDSGEGSSDAWRNA